MMRRNLFISNSKRIKSVISIVVIILILIGGCKLLNYNYVQQDDWCRILWHNYYKAKDIDNIYLGSSHVYCGINPFLMDELNGENNFNMAGPAQELISSYYIIKEVFKDHDISNVYLELYYIPSTADRGDYSSSTCIKNTWKNTDYMEPGLNWANAIINMNTTEHLGEALFPFVRYRQYLFDKEFIQARHESKKSDTYTKFKCSFQDGNGTVEYQDKGYYHTTRYMTNLLYKAERTNDEMAFTEDSEKYLRKIIEMCQEEGVGITLFVSPIYELQMLSIDNYDLYHNRVAEIADEYGVNFYDFNLAKEEYLPIQQEHLFMDVGHLNITGAEIFTEFFHDIVNGDPYENSKYFHESHEQKLAGLEDRNWGIYKREYEDKVVYSIAGTPGRGLQYKISVTPENGQTYQLQDFSENNSFELKTGETGVISVETKYRNGWFSSMEVSY